MNQPDSDLIDACNRFLAMERKQARLAERIAAATGNEESGSEEDLLAAADRQAADQGKLAVSIMAHPAATTVGLRMKARVAVFLVQYGVDGAARSSEDRIIHSLAQDILALTADEAAAGPSGGKLH
jgi:hypothetical protein